MEYAQNMYVDIFARAQSPGHNAIIYAVKNKDIKNFSSKEALSFMANRAK
jgi:hypothetical protein